LGLRLGKRTGFLNGDGIAAGADGENDVEGDCLAGGDDNAAAKKVLKTCFGGLRSIALRR
jgi:hypothetical protein